jgi:hypothetical protein
MAISPTALYSAFADDLEEGGFVDLSVLSRCIAALVTDAGMPTTEGARAFIERECALDSSDVTVAEAAIRFQLKGMLWKYLRTTDTDPRLDAVAFEKFMVVNRRLDTWRYSPNTSCDEELMGSFKELMWNFWNPQGFPLVTNLHCLLDSGSTGPGVAVGARGEDFYTKMFSSPLTYTSEALLQVYLDWTNEEPTWSRAESTRAATFGDPLRVQGSSLKFVPKDVRESRTIAVEPSLNMYFQLGLGAILEKRINAFFGIDLRTQQFWNREAARVGSKVAMLNSDYRPRGGPINWVSSLATIDLRSASDSLGLRLLEWALPPDFFALLRRLRSPVATVSDLTSVELNMVSTMGNGFTFPLETLIFSGVVVAAIKSFGVTPIRPYSRLGSPTPGVLKSFPQGEPGDWGVFGDDIVCHSEVAPRVLRLLSLLGFEVNSNKSFFEGTFRESCGCDFYRGHDIRAFYVKSALTSRTSLYKALNGFLEWSTRTGINLPNIGKLLLTELRALERRDPLWVPLGEGRDAGLRIPLAVLQELNCSSTERVRRDADTQSLFYERLVPHAKQLRVGDGYVAVPRKQKGRIFNPNGLLTAFLRGDVRDGRISVRQSDTRYRKRGCICPNWDYIPPIHDWVRLITGGVDKRRLESASRALLYFVF